MNINFSADSNYDLYYRRITESCIRSYEMNRRDILSIADEIMFFEGFPLYGAVYHYLIPALLLSTCKNLACHQQKSINDSLEEAYRLSVMIPTETCRCGDACGSSLGLRVFWNVILGCEHLPDETLLRGCAQNDVVVCGSTHKTNGKCCKRCLYEAILRSVSDVKNVIGVSLDTSEGIACRFYGTNAMCGGESCPFYFDDK